MKSKTFVLKDNMERDWQKECEWKDLQLSKAEDLLEKYSQLLRDKSRMEVKCVLLDENAEMPKRARAWDAGADCKAVNRIFLDRYGNEIDESNPENLIHATQVVYDLGIGVEVPHGHMLMACPKSSVYKVGMLMSNSFGIIDVDYQGRIKVTFTLTNHSRPYHEGDAVCQIILVPITIAEFYEGEFEHETKRGTGGHGSTGNLFKV